MTEENQVEVKEKKNKKKKKKFHSAGSVTIKVIAALMAVTMIFAVAASCIFYLQYYLK